MDSIGSFAESLIAEDLERVSTGKQSSFLSEKGLADPECPDISEVELNDNHRKALMLGEGFEAPVRAPRQEAPKEVAPEIIEDPIGNLITRLSYLVEKAESLVNRLEEQTAVGGLGTFQKFNLLGKEEENPKMPLPPRVTNKIRKVRKYRR